MYENYLLHPDAIAAVLNRDDAGREQALLLPAKQFEKGWKAIKIS